MLFLSRPLRSGFISLGVTAGFIIFTTLVLSALKINLLHVLPTTGSFLTNPSPTPTSTPTPSPTAVPSPTPTSTPTPTPSPTPKPTPKPTPSLPVISSPPGAGLTTATVATALGNFKATILTVDLNHSRMVTDTGNDGNCDNNCTVFSLSDYVSRNSGFAGVNGSYFCPATYSDCSSKTNSYDFPVYNTRLNKWINQDKLFWGERRAMVYVDGGGAHYLNAANSFSGGLTAGIVNYPGLIDGGNVQIDDSQSGLSDKQRASGTKVGLGVRDSQTIVVVIAQSVTMRQFAEVFKSLGVKGALNLDTGGSTALFSSGHYVYGPGRSLPNAVIFAPK